MIARNEEAKLARCLDSVRGVVDEIALVDTGSTDETARIAEGYGARVGFFEWCDDFSAARNKSLELVETEWTLWLDADEWLLPDSGTQIREVVLSGEHDLCYLMRQDYVTEDKFVEMPMPRLWRTDPELLFGGVIHEHFPQVSIDKMRPLFSRIRFAHDGFQGNLSEEKQMRNLALLESELAKDPGDLYYELCLADALCYRNDPRAEKLVAELTARVLAQDAPTEGMTAWLLGVALEMTPNAELFSVKTERIIKRAWAWFPHSPITMWGVAMAERRRGDAYKAYKAMKQLEHMAVTGEYFGIGPFNPGYLGKLLWKQLGDVAQELGDVETAQICRNRLLAES